MDITCVQNWICRRPYGEMILVLHMHPSPGIYKKLGVNHPKEVSIQPSEEVYYSIQEWNRLYVKEKKAIKKKLHSRQSAGQV